MLLTQADGPKAPRVIDQLAGIANVSYHHHQPIGAEPGIGTGSTPAPMTDSAALALAELEAEEEAAIATLKAEFKARKDALWGNVGVAR